MANTKVRSIIYGPDDKLTACIASWQLIQGNELFDRLGQYMTRYMHSPVVYTEGEERNHGVLELFLKSGDFGKVAWYNSIRALWSDFMVHAQELFMLDWEYIYRPGDVADHPELNRSKGASKLLSLAPCPIISNIQPIPHTERPVRAL